MRRATKSSDDARNNNDRGGGVARVSNHDDLDPFHRAGCRIRIVTNPAELTTAHIIIIPGSKSTIADLRWMKSRGLDQAIIEAATKRNVTVVGICGGYQILGKQLDGTIAPDLPIIGTYVHGLFDSPEILRRLLNTTAETHNLPKPLVTEFSMEAEYDRLAQTVRESIDMNLINSLIE